MILADAGAVGRCRPASCNRKILSGLDSASLLAAMLPLSPRNVAVIPRSTSARWCLEYQADEIEEQMTDPHLTSPLVKRRLEGLGDQEGGEMPDPTETTLTDEQMRSDYRTDRSFLPGVIRELIRVEAELDKCRPDQDTIEVSVRSLAALSAGIRALVKSQTELVGTVGLFGDGRNTGDRGANCDYNPFSGINFGDL